jgi:hypothetical protein
MKSDGKYARGPNKEGRKNNNNLRLCAFVADTNVLLADIINNSLYVMHKRNAYRILMGKPERKIPLGRPRRKWEDNSKMDLRGIGWRVMDWIHLAQYRDR